VSLSSDQPPDKGAKAPPQKVLVLFLTFFEIHGIL